MAADALRDGLASVTGFHLGDRPPKVAQNAIAIHGASGSKIGVGSVESIKPILWWLARDLFVHVFIVGKVGSVCHGFEWRISPLLRSLGSFDVAGSLSREYQRQGDDL